MRHFIEQSLHSIEKSVGNSGLDAEIIVIDNHSTDNSLTYLQPKFPSVKFIANKENLGFGKACNQGASIASGEFLLFVNPDTIIPEGGLAACIDFLKSNPAAGALGVRMIDGSGKFLKESKRAFPSPMTSLYKLTGLAAIFPKSKVFARYHLGHLDEFQNHEIDVLAGAFIMVRKEVFDKIGRFDEVFFMYGEDVDLSYRIQKAGYKNYYFSGTSIVHFKGESTRKVSLNYVRMFYKAMSIFVRKHYGGSKAWFFNFFIQLAIWLRAGISALSRFIQWIGLPVLDAALILLSFLSVKYVWSNYVKPDVIYEDRLLWIAFPFFTIIYLLVAYYAGLYDKWYKQWNVLRSTLVATVVLLATYSLLPERYRFSRGIILFGAFMAYVLISLVRRLFVRWRLLKYENGEPEHLHTLIAGTKSEYDEVVSLLERSEMQNHILGRVAVDDNDADSFVHLKKLNAISQSVPVDTLIFCEGRLSYREIIEITQNLPKGIKLKFHAAGSHSIVGSDSKDTSGEAYSLEEKYNLADPYRLRAKRLVDISFSMFFILTFPVHFFTVKNPVSFFSNCFKVLAGKRTWVGYNMNDPQLPPIRVGVISSGGPGLSNPVGLSSESLLSIDQWYARDYEAGDDIRLVWTNYRKLGRAN